jgi:hypothetical protein
MHPRKNCVTFAPLNWGRIEKLSVLMTESWTISVGGRVYGPYSFEQMEAFHLEGRLADHSLVARAGEDQFHSAAEDAALAVFFQVQQQPAATAAPVAAHAAPHKFGADPENTGERTHYVIIADMKSRSIAGLEEEIFNLGQAHRFMPQAWVLSSEVAINTIRHALVQKLGKIDTLFIVDAAHDKAAWFNFGPENDARVRRMWTREPAARKAG